MAVLPQDVTVLVSNYLGQVATSIVPGPATIIYAGQQGLPGPPGPSGPPAAALTAPAGVNITDIGTVVVLTDTGTVVPADPTNIDHATLLLGMNITTGSMGVTIEYLTVGAISGMSSLSTGDLYFVGAAGSLSLDSTFIGAVWGRALGNAMSGTTFILDKQFPVLLT